MRNPSEQDQTPDNLPPDGRHSGELPRTIQLLRENWPDGIGAPRLDAGGGNDVFYDRWSSVDDRPFELALEDCVEDHIFSLPLVQSTVVYNIGSKLITDNETFPGQPFLNGPVSTKSRKVYRNAFDVFRLGLTTNLLSDILGKDSKFDPGGGVHLFGPHVSSDRVIKSLLLAAAQAGAEDALFLESVGLALGEYVVSRYAKGQTFRAVVPLSKARLRKIDEFIESNLSASLSLTDLSQLAGLSRPRFSAQFKAATGKTPHAYITERRLLAAQGFLANKEMSLAEIASAVGFNDVAYFIATFRRHVGEAPSHWRRLVSTAERISSLRDGDE